MLLINQALLCAATDDVRGLQRLIDRSEKPLPRFFQQLWRRFFYSDLGDPWTQALLEAIRSQSHGCIALLAPLSRSTDRAPDGNNPLLEAIARWKDPDLRVLALLAQREDRFLVARDGFGDALSHALEAAGGVQVLEALLPYWLPTREDLASLARKKEKSLIDAAFRAVEHGYDEALVLLLDAQASRMGEHGLELYRPVGDDKAVCQQLLLNACTDPAQVRPACLRALLPFADPLLADADSYTPLMHAVMCENGWAIDALRPVSNVNALNAQGQTAIEMALAHRNPHEHWGMPQQGLDALALASERGRTLRVFSSFHQSNPQMARDLMPRFLELWQAHEERSAIAQAIQPTASKPTFELELDTEPATSSSTSPRGSTVSTDHPDGPRPLGVSAGRPLSSGSVPEVDSSGRPAMRASTDGAPLLSRARRL